MARDEDASGFEAANMAGTVAKRMWPERYRRLRRMNHNQVWALDL